MIHGIPCQHNFLDLRTTLVVSQLDKRVWCVICGQGRPLKVLSDFEADMARAAKVSTLYVGESHHGDN